MHTFTKLLIFKFVIDLLKENKAYQCKSVDSK